MNQIDAAIEAAKTRAATLAPASQDQVVAGVPALTSVPVGMPAAPSMEGFMNSGFAVDTFLKVKDAGLSVGSTREYFEGFDGEVTLSEVKFKRGIRYNSPTGGVIYRSTVDGVTTEDGRSWEAVVAQAQQFDPKAYPYETADVPIVSTATVKGRSSDLVKPGLRIGHTLAPTNKANFQRFVNQALEMGYKMDEAIPVRVGFEVVTRGSNTYGLVTFTVLTN